MSAPVRAAWGGNTSSGIVVPETWKQVDKCTPRCTPKYMAKTYTIASARAKLADIVDEVEAGSDVELTRRGKKVAVVISASRYARLRGEQVAFMTAYETFRASHDLVEAGLDRSWSRGLRARDVGRPVKF